MNTWLIFFALITEGAGVGALFSIASPAVAMTAYFTAHMLASAVLTVVLIVWLPPRYRNARKRSALLLFTLQFAIPFLGSLGVFGGVLLALYLPRSSREVPWQRIDIPELPYQPFDPDPSMIYSEGGLRQVLREAGDPGKRLKALLATRQMSGPEGVEILREALRDPSDDVRLLAYSMLEQKEKTLAAEAGRIKKALDDGSSGDSLTRWKRRLAQVWWEMAYLGLAQGGLRQYYLSNARELLLELVGSVDQHTDWRLLGRVELALGDHQRAGECFEIAMEGGAAQDLILPYLAEVAFLQRDYQGVRYYLARCHRARAHPSLRPVMEAWI